MLGSTKFPPSTGLVGGVKNSSSPETSPAGPMTSGHLQSHFQTADRTRFTSKGGMVRGGWQQEQNAAEWVSPRVEVSKTKPGAAFI